jgi:hypothetical protein
MVKNANLVIRLNLLSVGFLIFALVVWIGGSYKSFQNNGDNTDVRFSLVLSGTLSLLLLYTGFFILIYVFWHYGLNVDATIQKLKLKEEEKKKESENENAKMRINLDNFYEEEKTELLVDVQKQGLNQLEESSQNNQFIVNFSTKSNTKVIVTTNMVSSDQITEEVSKASEIEAISRESTIEAESRESTMVENSLI